MYGLPVNWSLNGVLVDVQAGHTYQLAVNERKHIGIRKTHFGSIMIKRDF